jgi:hypothetical protein
MAFFIGAWLSGEAKAVSRILLHKILLLLACSPASQLKTLVRLIYNGQAKG